MQKKIYSTILFFCFFTLTILGQIPPGYYNSAQGLSGTQLKTALHNIIKNHNSVSYNSLWTHFQATDKKSNNKVWDIYSDVPNGTPPYEYVYTSNQCGSYNSEGDCYNREHSWPQSWFSSETTPSSDLFHIYPTDGYVNNIRSNYPYGDVGGASYLAQNGGKLGTCVDAGYHLTAFEPIDEYKGDLARGYFYMSTRYTTEDAGWSSSAATNKSDILQWQVDVLLQWCHQDTVSAKEIARNNAIYQLQNNRNPFIDNPQWIDEIWTASMTGVNEKQSSVIITAYPNPTTDVLHLSKTNRSSELMDITVYSALGQTVMNVEHIDLSTTDFTIDCTSWNTGVYFIKTSNGSANHFIRIIKE